MVGRGLVVVRWWCHPVWVAVLVAGSLQVLWAVFLVNGGGDMAAQYAWTQFAASAPGAAYNLAWYGGMHPVSYSVLTPYLMAWLGVRTAAVVAGTLSAAVLARLLVRCGLRRPLLPAVCGAAGLSCDTASGRITFGIGVFFALAAVLVVYETRSRPLGAAAAGLLAVLATLASPVDGLFLLSVAPAMLWTGRRAAGLALAVGPVLVVATTTALFPFYGVEPFPLREAAMVVATTLPVALLAPSTWRTVRTTAWVYLLGSLLCLLIPSPVGSNVERLALLFAASVLLAAARTTRGRRRTVLWTAFALALAWQTCFPIDDLWDIAPASGWSQYVKPLEAELTTLDADRSRIEVVPTSTHIESSLLIPHVELARGWNQQVDIMRNPLFYRPTLTPAAYHTWLHTWAVQYVVLPNAPLDQGAVAEGRIVTAGAPWLQPVWHDTHWQLYRVTDAVPLASTPARVLQAGESTLTLQVPTAGSILVRVVWSPWLQILDHGDGCLTPDGPWTLLHAHTPGTYRIGAPYTLHRPPPCPKPTPQDH